MSGGRLSRRGFLTSAAVLAGSGAVAGVVALLDDSGTSASATGPASSDGSSAAGAGRFGGFGGFGRDGSLNGGIQTIASAVRLPVPFTVPLPVPATLQPTRSTADTDYYDIVQSVAKATILPGMTTEIWGYNGTFPGPTIVSTSGRRTVVTHRNELPVPTVVHLHGGRTPATDDGYPTDYLVPAGFTGSTDPAMPGMASTADPDADVTRVRRDYTYPMNQRAATLWYHDHRMDFTGPSVYRGLAGFHLVHDAEEENLPLPKGSRDIPLMICDRAFAADGSFAYPSLDPSLRTTPGVQDAASAGVMGDVVLVNGAPWPELKVANTRYRFRILNASNARTYQLALHPDHGSLSFTQVGSDGGLLAAPVTHDSIVIAPAQRFDVVIDFSGVAVGDHVVLTNLAATDTTANVMRFTVDRTATDTSSVPSTLSTVEAIDAAKLTTQRSMEFRRIQGEWVINGHPFDPTTSEASVKLGATELWTITSDFHHPVHLHLATLQVVSRDGGPPGPYDAGWKDTVYVNAGEAVQVAARFDGYRGRYMMHCHNLEHEDMSMMANFHVV